MATSGSISLSEVSEHTAVLTVACNRCERAGRYNLDTLIARHGAAFGIPALLRLLSDDCPKRQSITIYDQCGVEALASR
jgi:hypothetical protein